jgi:hypothetical protein
MLHHDHVSADRIRSRVPALVVLVHPLSHRPLEKLWRVYLVHNFERVVGITTMIRIVFIPKGNAILFFSSRFLGARKIN